MKRIALIILLLLASPVFAASRDAVVKITRSDGGVSGSGVCVDPSGIVLTAWHVVKNKGKAEWLVAFDKKNYRVISSYIPATEGVAILKIEGSNHPYLQIAKTEPAVGDTVWAMGYSFGYWKTGSGKIITKRVSDDPTGRNRKYLGTTVKAYSGMSGGPLITKNWRVTGITSFIRSTNPRKRGDGIQIWSDRDDYYSGHLNLSEIRSSMSAFNVRGTERNSASQNGTTPLYAFVSQKPG